MGLNLILPRKGVAHRLRTHKRKSSLFVRALIRVHRKKRKKTTPGIEHLVNVQYWHVTPRTAFFSPSAEINVKV